MLNKEFTMKKVLAVASGGGHWIQLLRLRPAFSGTNLRFMTTNEEFSKDIKEPLYVVTDANIWEKFKLVKMFVQVAWVMIRFRPDVVITTGAAPGFAAIFFGKIIGAKTMWLDSIANAEELSKSGKKAKAFAGVWLTQWEHLTDEKGPDFKGRVL
jgi:UDP-N-acetylglucosamine:LPS N-acetylglucosamine transferase